MVLAIKLVKIDRNRFGEIIQKNFQEKNVFNITESMAKTNQRKISEKRI